MKTLWRVQFTPEQSAGFLERHALIGALEGEAQKAARQDQARYVVSCLRELPDRPRGRIRLVHFETSTDTLSFTVEDVPSAVASGGYSNR